ncbi:MAG: flagellar export protein FliJ [Bdellovibrionia bacterium]
MRKFRFKFATLLKQRKSREETAMRQLAEAQRVYQLGLATKAELERTLEKALVRREMLGQSPVTITAFLMEQDYIIGTKQRIVQAQQGIVRATRGVEKALRTYLECRRQTKMMETLYEKHYEEFKRERSKKEAKAMEDFAVMRSRLNDDNSEGQEGEPEGEKIA